MAKPYYRGHDQWRKANPLREGTPCPRCGSPMYSKHKLDVGHTIDAALGGAYGPRRYEHSSCNRRAGGRLGRSRQLARQPQQQDNHSEEW